jgi:hypothetical protein
VVGALAIEDQTALLAPGCLALNSYERRMADAHDQVVWMPITKGDENIETTLDQRGQDFCLP